VSEIAGWIIDLGPEGGDAGGDIVAAGTPKHIVAEKRSYTRQFLKRTLARGAASKRKKRVDAAE
jgi:excinuclease ABC subunit A